MRSISRVLALVAVATLLGVPVAAQNADVSGNWNLQVMAFLPDVPTACEFIGTAQITQVGSDFSGMADLTLVSGPEGCPMELAATLSGVLDGNAMAGTLDGGQIGMASFSGTVDGAAMLRGTLGGDRSAATVAPKATPAGRFSAGSGPYSGTSGSWAAARQSVLEIPTLTETGLMLMALLLMASAIFFLVRGWRQPV